MGLSQETLTLVPMEEAKKYNLPDDFTIVPATALKKVNVSIPDPPNVIETIKGNLSGAKAQETCWLLPGQLTMPLKKILLMMYSSLQLLPLFYEKAAIAAMIKHGMDMLKKATQFLNPGQISVVALDAPLFAIAKLVQWNWPQTHGEEDFVMFGGLHIEMAIWKTFGDFRIIRLDECTHPGRYCFCRQSRFFPQSISPY